jgi:hypothetical protein
MQVDARNSVNDTNFIHRFILMVNKSNSLLSAKVACIFVKFLLSNFFYAHPEKIIHVFNNIFFYPPATNKLKKFTFFSRFFLINNLMLNVSG